MREETYNYIWEEIILDNIQGIYSQFSDEEKIRTGFTVKPLEVEKQNIYKKYITENNRLKELYHYGTDVEKVIDIHKIAACFTKVIMEEEVFKFSLKEKFSDEIFLANTHLAYYVGIGLIRMNLIVSYLSIEEQEIVNKLRASKQLSVPMTNKGHDEYNEGRKKTLMLNNVFQNEFDILTYSDMLFWIEYYNRQLLEQNLHPQTLPVIEWSENI